MYSFLQLLLKCLICTQVLFNDPTSHQKGLISLMLVLTSWTNSISICPHGHFFEIHYIVHKKRHQIENYFLHIVMTINYLNSIDRSIMEVIFYPNLLV